MATYIGGTAMIIQWLSNGGTVTLQNQYTKFDTPWNVTMVDTSSGSVTSKTYLPTLKDATATYEGFSDGKVAPLGTADLFQLEPATAGTLLWAPFGTVAGNPKGGGFAYVKTQDVSYPFANVVTVKLDWQISGTKLFDENTNVWP